MAPNILLVVLDAVRRDALEPYGAAPGSTPAIAELARRGTALPQAYATSSWTLPSHASMFTGLLPRQLGLGQAPEGTPQGARPALEAVADRVLANVLRRSGYRTRGWSTNLWASQYAGFDIGFEHFGYLPSGRIERRGGLVGSGPRAELAWALEGLGASSDDGAAAAGQALRESIQQWEGEPTFWFVNLCECHSPYLPPRPWNDLSSADRVRAALEARRHLSFESICLYVAGRHEIPPEALARMRHLYDRAARYMDSWLSDVLAALQTRGILEETTVIITSDHGENFGEGGLIAHGFSLDQRLIHVPLVMAGPGAREIPEVFSLAGLPRMLASVAGLDEHPWSRDELPEGIAVAQYDPLGPADHPRVRDAAEKWDLGADGVERLTARYTSVTDGRVKLVLRNGRELLFDLDLDPEERQALPTAAANGSLSALRDALVHPAAQDDADQPSRRYEPGAPAPGELAALEQQMKLLGYL